MPTNNFKVFNENMSNIEDDAQYLADAQRVGGVVPGVAPSALHNKLFRQVSIMAAALGQVIADRGYNASDADLTALKAAINSAFSPFATSANITYYVATTGNDSNNGLTSGTAFKTIGKAISLIPQICNHDYVINLAAGTYAETVNIPGFEGSGGISLLGGTDTPTALNYIISAITVKQNGCYVLIKGTNTTINGLNNPGTIEITFLNTVTVSAYGVSMKGCPSANVFNTTISNKTSVGILAEYNTHLVSQGNAGTGNSVGIKSDAGAVIAKIGGQPTGTTAELVANGGVIR